MSDNMSDYKDKYVKGTDWWTRCLVLLIIALTIIFVREILDIFRATGMEPYALIAMVGAIVAGEFSLLYFIFRNKTDIVKETVRYEREYESRPHSISNNDHIL
jgi:uncharacterized membrane protein